jgi:hypothetical protein
MEGDAGQTWFLPDPAPWEFAIFSNKCFAVQYVMELVRTVTRYRHR